WVAATSAEPAAIANLLHKAASVAARRRAMQGLRQKINQQLAPQTNTEGDEAEHQRQQQLERSERYLATLLTQAPQAFIAITPSGEIIAWNTAAEQLCGIASKATLGRRVVEVLPPKAAQAMLALVREALEHNAVSSREMPLELAPGTICTQVNAVPVRGVEHELGVSITLQDITESHKIMSRLRESESRYRILIETLPQLIWTARPEGAIDYFSRQWLEYTGLAEAGQLGSGWLEHVVHSDDRQRIRAHWAGAVQGDHPYDTDCRIRGADGRYRWFKLRATPIRGEDGAITEWFGTATDIEEIVVAREFQQQNVAKLKAMVEREIQRRATTEQALHRAQKMEAIGNLTGGIAHDFNNILQVISGNLHLLADKLAGDTRAQRSLRDALDGVDRGSRLVAGLLAFGRRQPLAPKVINIGRLVREMDEMLRRTLGERIELETSIAGGLWNTLVDRSNLESALLNLAINARDAMKGEGRLTIEVGNAFLDQAYADAQCGLKPGQYVMLAVTDTGCGVPPELMDKVFEPFFTTKSEGNGTGLGLSMVYGFVKQSCGHIQIYSEAGQGTTFKIYLPRSYESEDIIVADDSRPVRGGTETVLVVEDDDAVREMVVATLTGLGYTVVKARDAEAALSIIESGLQIDLLFTDVVMPGPLKSTELVRKARERLPNLAVLYTSGYTQNAIIHHGRLDAGVELLNKPYSRDALARKFRHVLANAAQAARNAPALQTNSPAQSSPDPPTVLLCEDEPKVRGLLGELLKSKGHQVLLAASGAEALQLASRHDIGLLITDLGLPDMSGLELAKCLRETYARCPVLVASGRHEPLPPELADARFLLKPFGVRELYNAISAVLEKTE
ncbi:MAG TPA: PAS domain S-box protein, partial [Nitrococcus sp.]|nr:PAS domain S-box protein [Nitrococcus sp.]